MRNYACTIPTRYNGTQFRSRLEARYAMLLTSLQVDWLYEFEGFRLDGGWYLPDFYLPRTQSWLEVKPTYPDERELRLAEDLCRSRGERVGIAYGDLTSAGCAVIEPKWEQFRNFLLDDLLCKNYHPLHVRQALEQAREFHFRPEVESA